MELFLAQIFLIPIIYHTNEDRNEHRTRRCRKWPEPRLRGEIRIPRQIGLHPEPEHSAYYRREFSESPSTTQKWLKPFLLDHAHSWRYLLDVLVFCPDFSDSDTKIIPPVEVAGTHRLSRTSKTYCYRQGDKYTLMAVWLQYCSTGNKYWYWKHLRFYRDSAKAFPHGTQWVRRYQVYYLRETRAKTPSCSGCVTVSNSQNDLLSKTAL